VKRKGTERETRRTITKNNGRTVKVFQKGGGASWTRSGG